MTYCGAVDCVTNTEKTIYVSVIIPVKNMTEDLIDKVYYYNTRSTDDLRFKPVILDSSDTGHRLEHKEELLRLQANENVKYICLDEDTGFFTKIRIGLDHIEDRYCFICAADDYYNINGIKSSLYILNRCSEVITLRGRTFVFLKDNKNTFYERDIDKVIEIMEPSPLERLIKLTKHHITQTIYSVYRTDDLKSIIDFMFGYEDFTKIKAVFSEYLFYFLVAAKGKRFTTTELINVRDNSPESNRYRIEGFFHLILSDSFNESYLIFKKMLKDFLMTGIFLPGCGMPPFSKNSSEALIYSAIDTIFKQFMNTTLLFPGDAIIFREGRPDCEPLKPHAKKILGG